MSNQDGKTEKAMALYAKDKQLGIRLKNGAKPLKKISSKHRQLIALIFQGYSGNEIAEILNLTPSRVSILRHDPLIEEVIQKHLTDGDQELSALFNKAVGVLNRGLDSSDLNHALSAADKVLKTQGKYKELDGVKQIATAEDVARQLIIEVNGQARITSIVGTKITTSSPSEREIKDVSNTLSGSDGCG